ncbi:MAG: hypothetical protein EOM24_28525 [Chloroflexia bacterium]|nr:hypothetical protein [Chloroflexia bacterium]
METQSITLARATPGRLITANLDGSLNLVWDEATIRIALYDLGHLAMLLDEWCAEEEPGLLRCGYYRLMQSPDGGIQLWLNKTGLCLSRDDLQILNRLIRTAEALLEAPIPQQPALPFGLGYHRLAAPARNRQWAN